MNEARAIVDRVLKGHVEAIEETFAQYGDTIIEVANQLADCFEQGNKVLVFGNGGSACDAMHFAGECVGRFVSDRRPLPAIALTADPGILTAIGNDYGFERIFARQVDAHAQQGDMVIAISTSGQSPNVLEGMKAAKAIGLHTTLLTGQRGETNDVADVVMAVPSSVTAHIQETHITLLQLMISLVETRLF